MDGDCRRANGGDVDRLRRGIGKVGDVADGHIRGIHGVGSSDNTSNRLPRTSR